MDRRVALAVALTAAGLAVAIVAADLQFNVTVSLETFKDGEWTVVASHDEAGFVSPRYDPRFVGCAGPDMRLIIDNGLLWSTTLDTSVTVFDYGSGRTEVMLERSLDVQRGERTIIPFTVPAWAQNGTTAPDGSPTGPAYLEARVGETYLNMCVGGA